MKDIKNKITPGKVIFTAIYISIFPFIILWLSGDWRWAEGWIFAFWFISLCTLTIIYLWRKNPALLAERFRKPGTGNQKSWDKIIVPIIVLIFFAWIVIIPLDAKRFSWSPDFMLWLKICGGVGLILSAFLFFRSYIDNPFLSPLARIQSEREHSVASQGVYAFVRHPMYLGGVLLFISAALLLGSFWGVVIGFMMAFLLAVRIIKEEKMLINELEKYTDYTKTVKYRLIPFIW